MKKTIILSAAFALLSVLPAPAQKKQALEDNSYRRSSLYSILVSHTDKKFNSEIENVFLQIPIPDSYNDHDLSVKIVNLEGKIEQEKVGKKDTPKGHPQINEFLEKNEIASRLVGKWFQRDFNTGECSMDLIGSRGLYAASEIDKAKAAASLKGEAMLADAGEDLIQNTFVLVNDITYVDKGARSKNVGLGLKILGSVAAIATGVDSFSDLGNLAGDMASTLKGFSVSVNTSLYQLVWDDESAALTYDNWCDRDAFENNRGRYRLKFVGHQLSKGGTTSFMGIREDQPEIMIRKACQRALDENIANLQQNFQAFQIKTPLESVEPLEARVGKKEGITENSRFEVLEPQKDANGKITYKKIGEIKPVPNLIWDNRYMAEEELAEGATLGCTTFKKVSGGDFLPGHLIRQIK
ncbi:MAG: hypothetical protein NC548_35805 [Lachnospiraceae bacterium]|nr:hypothetical protein [Lachnospiraceae bacterium]